MSKYVQNDDGTYSRRCDLDCYCDPPCKPCYKPCKPCKPCKPETPCPNPGEGIKYTPCYPCPECIVYDPERPPVGWPQFPPGEQFDPLRWENRGELPPERRCTLTPPLVNISAEAAFDAYQRQDLDGGSKVIFIDVRTHDEIYWVGLAAQVNSITLKAGGTVVPDYFKALIDPTCQAQANEIKYELSGSPTTTLASDIESINLTGISYNIPVEFIDTLTGESRLNPLFGKQCDALIRELQPDRIIFYCRSGQRSSIGCYYQFCPFEQLFPGVLGGSIIAYEVESPVNGRGGFEGTSYNNTFLGYRGFPGRYTADSGQESVAFKDMKLPIVIGTLPKTICVQPVSGATLKLDALDALPWDTVQP